MISLSLSCGRDDGVTNRCWGVKESSYSEGFLESLDGLDLLLSFAVAPASKLREHAM